MLRDFIRPLWGWIRHVMATEHFRVITILLYLNLTNHKMNPNNYQMWTHTHLPYVIKDLDTIIRNNPFSHNHDKILKSKLAPTKGEPKQTTNTHNTQIIIALINISISHTCTNINRWSHKISLNKTKSFPLHIRYQSISFTWLNILFTYLDIS